MNEREYFYCPNCGSVWYTEFDQFDNLRECFYCWWNECDPDIFEGAETKPCDCTERQQ